MNMHFSLRAVAIVLSLVFTTSGAELHYKFKAGETNAYRVSIESKSENNPQHLEGVIAVGVLNADGPLATISFGGTLQSAAGGRRIPFGRPGPFGPFGGFAPGMGGAPQGPIWPMLLPPPMIGQNECVVDIDGKVLKHPVMLELPKPLESYAALFYGRLPSTTNPPSVQLLVDDDLSANQRQFPRFGPHGMMQVAARLLGERKETVRVVETKGDEVRLERTVEFRTALKTGDEPLL